MTNGLLTVHIIAVAAWLGANMVQAFASAQVSGAEPAARRWWVGVQERMGKTYYNVAGILILVTGVGLVITSDDVYSFSNPFVSIGFVAVAVGAVLGITVFGPGARQIAAAIDEGDAATETATSNKLGMFGVIDTLVVVVTIVAMINQWGL